VREQFIALSYDGLFSLSYGSEVANVVQLLVVERVRSTLGERHDMVNDEGHWIQMRQRVVDSYSAYVARWLVTCDAGSVSIPRCGVALDHQLLGCACVLDAMPEPGIEGSEVAFGADDVKPAAVVNDPVARALVVDHVLIWAVRYSDSCHGDSPNVDCYVCVAASLDMGRAAYRCSPRQSTTLSPEFDCLVCCG